MRFPNAAKGISKLFTAEILGLFGLAFLGVSGVLYYANPEIRKFLEDTKADKVPMAGTICAVFAAIALVIMIIGAIIKIVGVIQAAKDEGAFKAVIYVTILAIVVSVIISILAGSNKSALSTGFSNTIQNILSLVTTFLVIGGISNLADQLGDEEMIARGASIIRKIFWMLVLAVLANIIAAFTHKPDGVMATVAVVLAIIAGILSFIAYVLYVIFLAKAKKMLQK